jgi:hypothetical protein
MNNKESKHISKRSKILSVLFFFALFSVFILIFHPIIKPERTNDQIQDKSSKKIDLSKMEDDYRSEIKIRFSEIYTYLTSAAFDSGKLESIKSGILSLRVPVKYKDLHLELVLAIDKMENFEKYGKMDDKKNSLKILDQVKNENKWIL